MASDCQVQAPALLSSCLTPVPKQTPWASVASVKGVIQLLSRAGERVDENVGGTRRSLPGTRQCCGACRGRCWLCSLCVASARVSAGCLVLQDVSLLLNRGALVLRNSLVGKTKALRAEPRCRRKLAHHFLISPTCKPVVLGKACCWLRDEPNRPALRGSHTGWGDGCGSRQYSPERYPRMGVTHIGGVHRARCGC